MNKVYQKSQDLPLDILKNLDAVLVLGGGVPSSVDEPPIYVQKRCDDAAKVVKIYTEESISKDSVLPILTLSAGTAHLPQLMSADGAPVWESTSSAAYLQKRHGIVNVYVETTSYDTIGNAYYTRTSHTDVNGWRRLLIITNEVCGGVNFLSGAVSFPPATCLRLNLILYFIYQFHMKRTKAIFDWIFGIGDNGYELCYLESENTGLTEKGLEARRLHEAKGEQSVLNNLAPQHITLKEVWKFLNEKHDLYTALKLADRARQAHGDNRANKGESRSDLLKESYGAK